MSVELGLKILLIGAMIATAGVLMLGVLSMFKKGNDASRQSQQMMRLRILFQAFALLIFSLLLFLG